MVNSNKEFYTKMEVNKADKARLLQGQLGWPSTQAFATYVNNNLINNRGITSDDVNRAQLIYGPPVPILKGKMKRIQLTSKHIKRVALPPPILEHHHDLHLYVDFFYVNKLPFLHTKSSKINFLTVQSGPNRTKGTIQSGIEAVLTTYKARGFNITYVHGDNEFNLPNLHQFLQPAALHIYGRNEHVGVVKRSIQTLKERCRCMSNAVPFRRYTKLMTRHLVETAVYWLNSFPSANGVSQTLSPANIVLGRPNTDFTKPKISFGSYAFVYTGTTNTMKSRSVPGIALGPSNESGGYFFMSLYTRKRLHSYHWKELPIDQDVID
jgi:hypothetical protein